MSEVRHKIIVDPDNPTRGANVVANTHTSNNELCVTQENHVCTENTTITPLGIGGVFTGSWQDVLNYGVINVTVIADEGSATDGLEMQWSNDGVSEVSGLEDKYTITANKGKSFSAGRTNRYFRVKYTNGATAQGSFSLTTIISRVYVKPSSHRIQDSIVAEDDAELVKAVLTGQDVNDTFRNVNVTEDGDLVISDNSSGLAIAEGNVTGKTFIHKFGNAPDFDTADGSVTIWDGAANGTAWENMVYDYSSTADIDSISSSNAGDTVDVEIQGLDTNYDTVTQTITLSGQTRVALTTALIRVFRMKNVGATDLLGSVVVYPNTGLTGGVPTDHSKIRAIINNGNNQTLMSIYTIPAGKTGYLRDWYASTAGANKSSSYIIKLKARPFGQVFQIKHISSIGDEGSSHIQHIYEEPETFYEKTDIEMTVSMTAVGGTGASVSAGFDMVLVDN